MTKPKDDVLCLTLEGVVCRAGAHRTDSRRNIFGRKRRLAT